MPTRLPAGPPPDGWPVGTNTRPRSTSTVMPAQALGPEPSGQKSGPQVSNPASPGLGSVRKLQINLPDIASNARTSPAGPFAPGGPSAVRGPMMTRFLKTAGGDDT